MAHKKAAGSSKNGRDSAGQRLGIKVFGTLPVSAGSIIVRQRGTRYRAGKNVYAGRDHSLLAAINGLVQFSQRRVRKYDGRVFRTTFVHVAPSIN